MKLRLKTTFLALTILQLSLAQQINGTWNGKLNVQGQEIPLVFHFTENKKEIKGTMDSPSQSASGITIEKITFKKNELFLSMMGGSIEYSGELKNNTIEGLFKQSGMEFNLNLTKGEMKKPGNTKLPSTDEELKALAAKEKGKYAYAVNDYFAKPKSFSFQLSPNGTFLSYREKDENLKNHVYVKNIKSGEIKRVIEEKEELIRGYGWANDSRIVYVMDKGGNEDYHLFAVDIDGKNQKELTPYKGVKVNIIEMLKEDKDHMIISMNKNNAEVFDPYKINIKNGEIEQLYENKDITNPIANYVFDKDGNLRGYAKLKDGMNYEIYYQKSNGKFEVILETNWDDSFFISSFNYASTNKNEAYVVSNLNSDKTEVFRYDLEKK